MKKVRVLVHGTQENTVVVEAGATEGAQFGRDITDENGNVLTLEALIAMAQGAVDEEQLSVSAWEVLLNIPPNIKALENASGSTGIFSVTGAGTGALRELEVGAASAVSLSILNPGGVAGPPMFIVDPTLNALAGLDATLGLLEQTGADIFSKRAIGVASPTDVLTRADGDGRYDPIASAAAALAAANVYTDAEIADLSTVYQPLINFAANQFGARSSAGPYGAKVITDLALSLLDDSTQTAMLATLGIVAGTYVPTATLTANASAATFPAASPFMYARIGDIVLQAGQVSITPSGVGVLVEVQITPAVASNFANFGDAVGVGVSSQSTNLGVVGINADGTNNRIRILFNSFTATIHQVFIVCVYRVLP